MTKVLFVCTGNTCRSPMAEAIFNEYAKQIGLEAEAVSAGIFCLVSTAASENSMKAMQEMELDISSHRSRQVTEDIIRDADIIMTMSKSHSELLNSHYPKYSEKIYDLTRYVDEFGEIEDPYEGTLLQYAKCRNRLAELIERLVVKLKKAEMQNEQ